MAFVTRILAPLLAVVGGFFLLAWGWTLLFTDIVLHWHWLQFQYGYRNGDGNSPHYLFYSGSGSIILPPVLTVALGTTVFLWHNQCSVGGCYWYARRKTAAGDRACWLHHPRTQLTREEVRRRHHLYLGKNPGKG